VYKSLCACFGFFFKKMDTRFRVMCKCVFVCVQPYVNFLDVKY
jgi:hypothetical protein